MAGLRARFWTSPRETGFTSAPTRGACALSIGWNEVQVRASRTTYQTVLGFNMLLHLGIGLVMGLSVFSLLMLVMVLAFVPPEVMHVFVDELRAKGRGWFKAGAEAPVAAKEPLVLSRT